MLAQGYPALEHVVVDGFSTDGTPEVLARYPSVRVIREQDAGLYDALNKGVAATTGDVIGHLNDDDVYRPDTFAAVAAAFADPAVEVVSGGAEILSASGEVAHRLVRRREVALTLGNITLGAPLLNARFFRRSFCQRVGRFDLRYRISADREFLLRAALAQPRGVELEQIFYEYRAHSDSLTFGNDRERDARWRREDMEIAETYLADGKTDRAARPWLRRWLARETAQAALAAGRRGDWPAARAYARKGRPAGWAWPVAVLRNLVPSLLGP